MFILQINVIIKCNFFIYKKYTNTNKIVNIKCTFFLFLKKKKKIHNAAYVTNITLHGLQTTTIDH